MRSFWYHKNFAYKIGRLWVDIEFSLDSSRLLGFYISRGPQLVVLTMSFCFLDFSVALDL